MFEFTEEERESLKEARALSTDSAGNEVLVGLTLAETIAVMEHRRAFRSGNRDRANRERYSELNDKHERSRLEVIGAEIHRQTFDPPIQ